ncbi:unnamed protein product [Brachionus calyciflorus]|uniref:Retropepsins domain-containing protein n=1 Tax=Brachionus calyciflorus TaxID=104777 RepID=A0A813SD24_9BILA|nr:unnamed protein product [Brachionus calyciflorus]
MNVLLHAICETEQITEKLNEREELTILRADQKISSICRSLYFNKKDNESSQSDDESDNEEDYNLNKEKLETNINNYKLTNITVQSFFLDNSVLNESKLPVINNTETIKTDPSTSNYYRVEPSVPYKTSSSEYVPTPININPIRTQTNELLINNSVLGYSNKTIAKERETDHLNNGSSSEDVDDWLINIDQAFISANIREEDKLTVKLNEDLENKVYVEYLDKVGPKNICSIKGLVDNKTLKLGLDCGTTNSIMNNMTVIKNKIEILRSNLKIRTANGKISHISGIRKPLEVNISGYKCLIEFLVFDHEDHDVLLGLDWFNKTWCEIFPSQGILKFKEDEKKSIEASKEEISDIFHTEIASENEYFWDTSDLKIIPASDLETNQKK